jgi:hypothetical protein
LGDRPNPPAFERPQAQAPLHQDRRVAESQSVHLIRSSIARHSRRVYRGLAVRPAVRLSIRQALAPDTLNRLSCPFLIINAQRFALVVPEIKFGQIPLQVLLADMPRLRIEK